MKQLIFILFLTISTLHSFSQKKPLEFAAIDDWPMISGERISNDGNYVFYTIESGNLNRKSYIQSTFDSFRIELPGTDRVAFSSNGKFLVCLINDTLKIFNLQARSLQNFPRIRQFDLPLEGDSHWISYLENSENNTLTLLNQETKARKTFKNVKKYFFNSQGNKVVILAKKTNIDTLGFYLLVADLQNGSERVIWQGENASSITFSPSGNKMAFLAWRDDKTDVRRPDIYLFDGSFPNAILVVNGNSRDTSNGLKISMRSQLKFSTDEKVLYYHVEGSKGNFNTESTRHKDVKQVRIWNYLNKRLLTDINQQSVYLRPLLRALCIVGETKDVAVESNDSTGTELCQGIYNDKLLLTKDFSSSEMNHKLAGESPCYIIHIPDGKKSLIGVDSRFWYDIRFSPTGKFITWYDRKLKNYFVYRVSDSTVTNISASIKQNVFDEIEDRAVYPWPYGIMGWFKNDSVLFIYDHYDIWKVDPLGGKSPVNVTSECGRRDLIIFRHFEDNKNESSKQPTILESKILLTGFNEQTKEVGIYSINLSDVKPPFALTNGPYIYPIPQLYPSSLIDFPYEIEKSKNTNKYLLRRMSCEEYPNLYVTDEFKKFVQLTDLEPQKKYNWFTSELVHWVMFDGSIGTGILFKPENFDEKKKYPIIFHFYEKSSEGLRKFIHPELSSGELNIPYFVSNGYLVFVPDIFYKVGSPGESAYNCVVSAAEYLSRFSWVNSSKMGLQGHSFGGYETNYIISRTHKFAAACEAAGPWDLISMYNSVRTSFGVSAHYLFEIDQFRLGCTLWENPQKYIDNSPIFRVNEITTPILLMHSMEDGAVPLEQAIEGFTALRRLGKPSWFIEYEGEDHSLNKFENKLDYSIRLAEFFGYYLKDTKAPLWMK